MLAIIQKAAPFCKGKTDAADAMFRRVFAPSFWRWFLYGPLKARCATLLLTAGCPLVLLSLLDFRGHAWIAEPARGNNGRLLFKPAEFLAR
jgi:hypothetical protein